MDLATWTVLGVWAQALVVLGSAFVIAGQLGEAKKARRAQSRPYVAVRLAPRASGLVAIRLENVGSTAALDVAVSLNPAPRLANRDALPAVLDGTTPLLPSGLPLDVFWNTSFALLADDYDGPTSFTATLTYRDPQNNTYEAERYVVDARILGAALLVRPGVPEVAEAIQKLQKQAEKAEKDANTRTQLAEHRAWMAEELANEAWETRKREGGRLRATGWLAQSLLSKAFARLRQLLLIWATTDSR